MEILEEAKVLQTKLIQLLENSKRFETGKSDGFTKYQSAIKAEIKHLKKVLENPEKIKPDVLAGCNYYHLEGIMRVLIENEGGTVYPKYGSGEDQVRIDVATSTKWIKIKARKRYLFGTEEIVEESSDDEDQVQLAIPDCKIVKQAKEIMKVAQQNHTLYFKPPLVVFQFVRLLEPLPIEIQTQLESIGVIIEYGSKSKMNTPRLNEQVTDILNLDIPTRSEGSSLITQTFQFNSKPGSHPWTNNFSNFGCGSNTPMSLSNSKVRPVVLNKL